MSSDKKASRRPSITDEEALEFHSMGKPGKIEINPTKPMATQRDLSLAYSPGVAVPVRAIAENPDAAYDYTAKGNLVAVITNGTAILGLGDLGALASKPVMEGKAVLFKRFADVDSIDLEVDTKDVDEFIGAVRYLGPSFGGINLEDIKAPECFMIEQRLREIMDIPVFHDDQHGTAIIATAALINALHITKRDIKDFKLVCNGAGAAAIACIELIKSMGVPAGNVILADSKGVVYQGRTEGMNQWKSAHATVTKARSLADAMEGADVFFGLSVAGALTPAMVKSMAKNPIIFAMANPDPEILPEEVAKVRTDAIMATGRSDYPNQVNNVLGFPYIFRGALDVRARTINEEMKIAAAQALASLAREDVPDEVAAAYHGSRLAFGPEYLIPVPFDPRLISRIPVAVAKAAMDSGVARKHLAEALASLAREDVPDEVAAAYHGSRLAFGPQYLIPVPFDPRLISRIPVAVAKAAMDSGVARKHLADIEEYTAQLSARLDPIAGTLQTVYDQVRSKPKRVVFAEGEEDRMIRAANSFATAGLGTAILIGRETEIEKTLVASGLELHEDVKILNARLTDRNVDYANYLYERLQRNGFLFRDCQRFVNQDRNVFASCMVALGDADALVTGLTRNFSVALDNVRRAIDNRPGHRPIGVSMALVRGRTVFIADTSIHELPTAEELADIAQEAAGVARRFGYEPRVAFLSYSTFGYPRGDRAEYVRNAVAVLDKRNVDFEYDGEMAADVALSRDAMALYPFCRLTAPANVLVMPAAHSASISTKMLQQLGGITVVGPLLTGLAKPVQIASMSATTTDIVNLAAIAAFDINR